MLIPLPGVKIKLFLGRTVFGRYHTLRKPNGYHKIMILAQHWYEVHELIKTRGCVTLYGLAIYIKKYFKAKEELWKLKYFTIQKYNLPKILEKEPKSFKML
jgi:hypothetical protein